MIGRIETDTVEQYFCSLLELERDGKLERHVGKRCFLEDALMPGIMLTFPIVTGKVEAWRRFCQELSGSRRRMYEASRQRLGITRERVALVETAFGAAAVTTLEAPDVDRALGQIIASAGPFDRWYREKVRELHGINLAGYEHYLQHTPLPPEQELIFEWTYLSRPDSRFEGAS